MVIFVKYSVMFHLHFFSSSFSNHESYRYIQLSLGNRVATFLGKSCQLCLSSVLFAAFNCICLSFPLMLRT